MTKKRSVIFFCVFLLICIGVYGNQYLTNIARAGYSFFVTSFLTGYLYVTTPFTFLYDRFYTDQQLLAQIDILQQKYDILLQEHILLMDFCGYTRETKELLDFKKKHSLEKAICARIMLRSLSERGHTMTINAGNVHGVKEDMVVFVFNNLLGKVSTVYPFHTIVTLITDRSCKVACSCFTTKTKGIYEGTNTLCGTLSYVNPLSVTKEGDYVFSTGQGMIFPQGLLLGKIVWEEKDNHDMDNMVCPLIQIDEIDHCLVASRADLEIIFH